MSPSSGIPPDSLPSSDACGLEMRHVDPLRDPEWDRMAANHPEAGIFHGTAWARVLRASYGHRPFYLTFRRKGELAALIPLMEVRSLFTGRRGVSVPFADFCAPLYFEGGDRGEIIGALTRLALEKNWNHFELRGGTPPDPSATPSFSFYAHTLDLGEAPDALAATLPDSVRRAIRKAERSGVTTEIRSDKAAVVAYYHLHVRTRRRHGLPPQPLAFFLNIWEHIISAGLGSVVLAFMASVPVAGAVFFHSEHKAVYKFGASDERVLGSRVNNLVMWSGIRFLAGRGVKNLHFGRSSPHQDGLRRFKRSWGAAESVLPYFRFDIRLGKWVNSSDRVSGGHNAVFSRLPLAINRLAGRLIYPHLD